jgi:hypothetical protein
MIIAACYIVKTRSEILFLAFLGALLGLLALTSHQVPRIPTEASTPRIERLPAAAFAPTAPQATEVPSG